MTKWHFELNGGTAFPGGFIRENESRDVHPSMAQSDEFSRVAITSCDCDTKQCGALCVSTLSPPPLSPPPQLPPPLPLPSSSSSSSSLPARSGYRFLRESRRCVQLTARLWNVYARRSGNTCPTICKPAAFARARFVISACKQRWFHPCLSLIRARTHTALARSYFCMKSAAATAPRRTRTHL